jgi:uncharacterized protein YdbL (DUF1318 family)
MKKNKARFVIPLAVTTLVLACVTVNIYFPAKEVEQKAQEIVDEIRKKEPTPPSPAPPSPRSSLRDFLAGFRCAGVAFAQKEAEVSSPAIRGLKAQMKDRYPRLLPFFQKGSLGEGNKGYLELKDTGGMTLQEKREVQNLMEAENADRRTLYQEVAKSLNISPDQLLRVQRIFAEKWQQSLLPGWWYQKEDGSWIKK